MDDEDVARGQCAEVPELDRVVADGTREDVLGDRVPEDLASLARGQSRGEGKQQRKRYTRAQVYAKVYTVTLNSNKGKAQA